MPEAGRQGLSRRRLAKEEGSLPVAGPRRPDRILHVRREQMSRCALDRDTNVFSTFGRFVHPQGTAEPRERIM